MEIKEYQQFMPGAINRIILEQLCDYFLPAHIDVVTEFELAAKDKTTRLDDGVDDSNSTLGLSTYL